MKLEELRKKAEASWEGCHGCDENDKQMWINGYITGALVNQLELPSDEEIEEIIKPFEYEYTRIGFRACAEWLKNKIQGGNK